MRWRVPSSKVSELESHLMRVEKPISWLRPCSKLKGKSMKLFKEFAGMALGVCVSSTAFADLKPAVIFDLGGKFDKSFNEASWEGAELFSEETGVSYRDFELQSDAQREQALRRFSAQRHSPIVVAGFSWRQALQSVASEFPDTHYVIIDSHVDLPNVRSVKFSEHEGSYLVGILSAMASKSKKLGFIGGMDIPLVRAFSCGFRQGATATVGSVEILENMTGTTGSAWNDPVKGGELARSQIGRGADVVYHAAGGTGLGVLQAVADAGALGVGVDKNQNYLHPGRMLTSMLKRVDVAVYSAMMDEKNGSFTAGLSVLGLAEGGVGVAIDEHNRDLINPEMQSAVDTAAAAIISGEIVVHDYRSNDSCDSN